MERLAEIVRGFSHISRSAALDNRPGLSNRTGMLKLEVAKYANGGMMGMPYQRTTFG